MKFQSDEQMRQPRFTSQMSSKDFLSCADLPVRHVFLPKRAFPMCSCFRMGFTASSVALQGSHLFATLCCPRCLHPVTCSSTQLHTSASYLKTRLLITTFCETTLISRPTPHQWAAFPVFQCCLTPSCPLYLATDCDRKLGWNNIDALPSGVFDGFASLHTL